MRRVLRVAWLACGCMLCLWLLSALVQGPAPSESPQEREPLTVSALLSPRALAAQDGVLFQENRKAASKPDAVAVMAALAETPVCSQSCDGNGWLVIGQSWQQAAYAACPPEGMPG